VLHRQVIQRLSAGRACAKRRSRWHRLPIAENLAKRCPRDGGGQAAFHGWVISVIVTLVCTQCAASVNAVPAFFSGQLDRRMSRRACRCCRRQCGAAVGVYSDTSPANDGSGPIRMGYLVRGCGGVDCDTNLCATLSRATSTPALSRSTIERSTEYHAGNGIRPPARQLVGSPTK
jgi:hypothetical protein